MKKSMPFRPADARRACRVQTLELAKRLGALLRDFRTGHPQWYAELLVAAALDGVIQSTNNPKFDILTPEFGRVEVKNRVDGTDGVQNRVNFGRYAVDDFDHAAIVILASNYCVKEAILLPCRSTLALVRPHGHVKWSDAAAQEDAVIITEQLQRISCEHNS